MLALQKLDTIGILSITNLDKEVARTISFPILCGHRDLPLCAISVLNDSKVGALQISNIKGVLAFLPQDGQQTLP
jgi:hypothetical protein